NMLTMPHLQKMQWDCADRLQMTSRQAVNAADVDGVSHAREMTYYVYDSTGERVRKATERNGKLVRERIYLSGFEVYREYDNGPDQPATLERNTLQVMDDKQRVALIETRTAG